MAVTTNLRLSLIEGSDVVDYSVLNGWMNSIDKLGVEYVTKKGKYGDYWYRIWSSGRCECGVDNRWKYSSLTFAREWASSLWIPSGRLNPFGDYPVNFVDRPYAAICFNYCSEEASCIVIQSSTGGPTHAPEFVLANNNRSTLTNVQLSIFCTGNATSVRQ